MLLDSLCSKSNCIDLFQVLRFSRLFKPVYAPHIWRKKKKKKAEGEEEGEKEKSGEEKEKSTSSDTTSSQKLPSPVRGQLSAPGGQPSALEGQQVQDEEEDEDPYADYCPFKLDLGRTPEPHEIEMDDAVCILY